MPHTQVFVLLRDSQKDTYISRGPEKRPRKKKTSSPVWSRARKCPPKWGLTTHKLSNLCVVACTVEHTHTRCRSNAHFQEPAWNLQKHAFRGRWRRPYSQIIRGPEKGPCKKKKRPCKFGPEHENVPKWGLTNTHTHIQQLLTSRLR